MKGMIVVDRSEDSCAFMVAFSPEPPAHQETGGQASYLATYRTRQDAELILKSLGVGPIDIPAALNSASSGSPYFIDVDAPTNELRRIWPHLAPDPSLQ